MHPVPKLTQQQVLAVALNGLRERQMVFDEQEGLDARYSGVSTKLLGLKGQPISFWTVSYLTSPNSFGFDQEMFFIKVDDDNAKVLYITGPREYIE